MTHVEFVDKTLYAVVLAIHILQELDLCRFSKLNRFVAAKTAGIAGNLRKQVSTTDSLNLAPEIAPVVIH